MEHRNPVFNSFGTIDCEINHPDYGWIPFTADPSDTEPLGTKIFNAAKNEAAPYVEPPIPTGPTHEELVAIAQANRQVAFQSEADPLFFKWQAGEGTQEEWLAKREEIRLRYPYPTEE